MKRIKKKRGRPSKKDDLDLSIAMKLAEYGHTMEEIADIIDVAVSNLYKWMKDKRFREAIKKGREVADDRVVNSLYARALGYEYDEITYEKIKCGLAMRATKEEEDIEISEIKAVPQYKIKVVTKKVIPDVTAQIFWLKNRQPEQWKDRVPEGAGSAEELVKQELEFKTMPRGKINGRFAKYYN